MIGILALQGGFVKHADAFLRLGESTCYVKNRSDLQKCAGLVIPGGESTAIRLHLQRMEMVPALKEFAKAHPIFGTCAGLILMVQDLGILDICVQRNGFGSQIHSFSHVLESAYFSDLQGVFIRAPRICSCGDSVHVLADFKGEPVLVRQGLHMAATFHPELTDDLQVHRTFVEGIRGKVWKGSKDRFLFCTENDHAVDGGLPARTQTG